jgi:hypothetical protein
MSILSALGFDTRKISNESLRRLNIAVAGLLLLQGLIIILMAPAASRVVQTSFLSQDAIASQSTGHKVLLDATQHLFDVNPTYLAAAGLLGSAIMYAALATLRRRTYQQELARSVNGLRWSGGAANIVLIVLAAALFIGVGELGLLLATSLAAAAVFLMAGINEDRAGSKRIDWQEAPAIWLAGITLAGVLAIYLWGAYVYGAPPTVYQYAVFVVLSTYSGLMAAWSLRSKVPAKDYARRERAYSLANLVTISALAWLIFAGLSR